MILALPSSLCRWWEWVMDSRCRISEQHFLMCKSGDWLAGIQFPPREQVLWKLCKWSLCISSPSTRAAVIDRPEVCWGEKGWGWFYAHMMDSLNQFSVQSAEVLYCVDWWFDHRKQLHVWIIPSLSHPPITFSSDNLPIWAGKPLTPASRCTC